MIEFQEGDVVSIAVVVLNKSGATQEQAGTLILIADDGEALVLLPSSLIWKGSARALYAPQS